MVMDRALKLSFRCAGVIWGLTWKIILAHGHWLNEDLKERFKWLPHSRKGKSSWVQGSPHMHLGLFPLSPKELCCSLQGCWEATHKSLWLSVVSWWEGWSDVNNRKWAQSWMLWCALSLLLRVCERWMSQ